MDEHAFEAAQFSGGRGVLFKNRGVEDRAARQCLQNFRAGVFVNGYLDFVAGLASAIHDVADILKPVAVQILERFLND